MQQILLAQTEELSNSGRYFISSSAGEGTCTANAASSAEIETSLFSGGDVITSDAGSEMCIYEDDDNAYRVRAVTGCDDEGKCSKEVILTHNGIYDPED